MYIQIYIHVYLEQAAKRAMDEMQRELGCSADEETYALLAAGWAQVELVKI